MQRTFFRISIVFIVTGIMLGAMAAHSLEKQLTQVQLASFKTGTQYQLYNGLGLLMLSLGYRLFNKRINVSLWLICIGTLLFSGSIYLLTTGTESIKSILGPITPIGGSLMIVGWALLFFAWKGSSKESDYQNGGH